MCVLTILMAGYLIFSLHLSSGMASAATLTSIDVAIHDSLSTHFLTEADIVDECGIVPDSLGRTPLDRFDLDGLEKRLRASDKIQHVNAAILSSGRLHIDVVPMTPVARVFERGHGSYYINAAGKKISAEPRHHLDVPVVTGAFDSLRPAARLLPLLDRIASDPGLSALVSTVVQEPDGDIILVPVIVGHVINFGDTSCVDDKFARLTSFYRLVAPHKGWQMYDTVAVKWRGQLVATKRRHALDELTLPAALEDPAIYDFDDDETITDPLTVAAGIDNG